MPAYQVLRSRIRLAIALLVLGCSPESEDRAPTASLEPPVTAPQAEQGVPQAAPEKPPSAAPAPAAPPALAIGDLRPTAGGRYRVSLRPSEPDIPLNQIHSWVFHVETADGRAFDPPRIAVAGGMPQHNHGFLTAPRVTRSLGGGDFLIEGVKFHMAGEWTFRLEWVGPSGPDVMLFAVNVGP